MVRVETFGQRLRAARERAGINQSELARRVPPLKAQAIQHLEDPKKGARGSKHTVALAQACGVDAHWLATGEGTMLAKGVAAAVSHDAMQIAIAWSKLSAERQQLFRELIFMQAALEARYPWLRRGRPKGETYAEWEARQEQNFEALVNLAAARQAKK